MGRGWNKPTIAIWQGGSSLLHIFNSTTLDCNRKFKDFFRSGRAVRRISDLLCAEHGLSVIENPKPSRGSYADWLGDRRKPSDKEILKQKIDEVLPSCSSFEDFLAALKKDGYSVNDKRKRISILVPGSGKPTRLDTLKGDYTESAIRERIAGTRIITASSDSGQRDAAPNICFAGTKTPNLLIDIQSKIQEGKGKGYEQWAKIFNLKQAAKTLIFLQEQGIDSYEDLVKKSSSSSGAFSALNKKIKDAETRMKEISDLQKQIGTYGKTKDVYAKYKASGWDRNFYDEYAADIILHRAAKKYFDGLALKKLPKMTDLKQEYATLAAEKKRLYGEYHKLKEDSRELQIACANAEKLLGLTNDTQKRDISRKKLLDNSYEK